MSKRLIIISVAGIVLIGGAYWYTNWYNQPSRTPPQPSPPVRQVARPRPPQPPTPAPRPQMQPKPVTPPVASSATGRGQKQAAVPPKGGTPSKVARPAPTPRESPKPLTKQAPARHTVQGHKPPPEKPAPQRLAMAAKPTVEPEKPYSVQVASLVIERNAFSLKKRLEKLGYRPSIEKTTAPITRHRVYAGEFSSREEAELTARRLGVDGFASNLVTTEKRKFALEVGWSYNLNEALDLAHSLHKKNYTSKIVSKKSPTSVHVVRVGAYEDRSDAVRASEVLKTKGFAPLVVRN